MALKYLVVASQNSMLYITIEIIKMQEILSPRKSEIKEKERNISFILN